jgi:hypothetical protein
MERHLNLARMAQAAEANTPQTITDTPADPAVNASIAELPISPGSRPS